MKLLRKVGGDHPFVVATGCIVLLILIMEVISCYRVGEDYVDPQRCSAIHIATTIYGKTAIRDRLHESLDTIVDDKNTMNIFPFEKPFVAWGISSKIEECME